MAAKKYYAVKKGRECGIFFNWESCKASVEGYSDAEFKGFVRLEDAREYLGGSVRTEETGGNAGSLQAAPGTEPGTAGKRCGEVKTPVRRREHRSAAGTCGEGGGAKREAAAEKGEPGRSGKSSRRSGKGRQPSGKPEQEKQSGKLRGGGIGKRPGAVGEDGEGSRKEIMAETEPERTMADPQDRPQQGTLLAYVDGSYDHSLRKYAFGCVFILPDGRIKRQHGNGNHPQSLQQRNVTGEMLGAMYAVRTAMISGFSKIEIRYDYEGIEKWVTGAWRSRTELTQKYAFAMRQWGESIAIRFTKVTAHSNVYYNEMADRTAKAGLREGDGVPKVCNIEEL